MARAAASIADPEFETLAAADPELGAAFPVDGICPFLSKTK
jgi:hypothetical protein